MRATTLQHGQFAVVETPVPIPEQGEVLVRTIACGICGSDLHAAKHTEEFVRTSREAGGAFKLTTFEPVILGHEFCAEVVDYGPRTERSVAIGKLVCSVPMLLRKPPAAIGYSELVPGGFSEYMLLSELLIAPVPSGLAAEHAALTEPMAVGFHAVNRANLNGKEAALVIGCGPVGLAVIIALKQRGVGPVIAADFSPRRRALAAQLGADEVFDPATEAPYGHAALTKPQGVVYFECVGAPGMIDTLFLHAPRNARLVIVGVCLQMDSSRPLIAINKELTVQYVLGYSVEEFVQTLHHIDSGAFNVAPLISGTTGLDGISDAFTALGNPEQHAKILVKPNA